MLRRLRDILHGRRYGKPVSDKQLAAERDFWWQRPQWTPSPVGRTFIVFGCPPGWKLIVKFHAGYDPMPHPHFHGGRLISLILRGGYIERRIDSRTGATRLAHRKPGRINWLPTHVAHTILEHPKGGKSITLLLIGPTVQRYGFWVDGKYVSIGQYLRDEEFKRAEREVVGV